MTGLSPYYLSFPSKERRKGEKGGGIGEGMGFAKSAESVGQWA
jgi:hypothetical protein